MSTLKFSLKLFAEITLKSDSVRKNMTKILCQNLRTLMRKQGLSADVQNRWNSLIVVVNSNAEAVRRQAIQLLTLTPGIGSVLEIEEHEFTELEEAYQHTLAAYRNQLDGKTFCVRIKRSGNHNFKSNQAEAYMGAGFLRDTPALKVDLKQPEVLIQLEIRNNKVQLVKNNFKGLGGFPLGSQGEVLSLISGGFDSTVSSYLMNRRGLKTHFCFFNLGGLAHEQGVKQVANFLWDKYGASHKVKFITVPFEGVVTEILTQVDSTQMGVVLKRMMLRAACAVARKYRISALVTGEAIAQVASQTITNLNVIDAVADRMVLRPLAAMDKQDIIDIARRIGTESFAATMPEYCGVISVNPTIVGDFDKVAAAESQFDMAVLDAAIAQSKNEKIDQVLATGPADLINLELVSSPALQDVILDIRHPNEVEGAELNLNNPVLSLPFYQLDSQLALLLKDHPQQRFLLYCHKGIMSKLHAHKLNQQHPGRFAVFIDS